MLVEGIFLQNYWQGRKRSFGSVSDTFIPIGTKVLKLSFGDTARICIGASDGIIWNTMA